MKTFKSFPKSEYHKGFGIFPYLVIRYFSGYYSQLPIRFFEDSNKEDPSVEWGDDGSLRITASESFINDPIEPVSLMNQILYDVGDRTKLKVCLVLSPFKAYYYFEEIMRESESIPAGGILVDYHLNPLASSAYHYYENQNFKES